MFEIVYGVHQFTPIFTPSIHHFWCRYKEIHESESIKNPVIPGYEVIYRVIKICSSLQKCKIKGRNVSQIDGLHFCLLL